MTIKTIITNKNTNPQTLTLDNAILNVRISAKGPVATWEIDLDDMGAASQQPQMRIGSEIEININDQEHTGDNNDHILMRGFVEKILPGIADPTAVFDRILTIKGRSRARDVARIFVKANFKNEIDSSGVEHPRIGDVFDKPLRYAQSLVTTPNAVKLKVDPSFVANGNAVVYNIENTDTWYFDLCNDSAEKTNYWWCVDFRNDTIYGGDLNNIPDYGVTLQSLPDDPNNNILEIKDAGSDGENVVNLVKVNGGAMDDYWTEDTANKLIPSVTSGFGNPPAGTVSLVDEHEIFVVGKASIKANCNNAQWRYQYEYQSTVGNDIIGLINGPGIKFAFTDNNPLFGHSVLDFHNIPVVNCHVFIAHNNGAASFSGKNSSVVIEIKDDTDHVMQWLASDLKKDEWTKIDFNLGYNATLAPGGILGSKIKEHQWWSLKPHTSQNPDDRPEKKFTWRIKEITVRFMPSNLITKDGQGNFTGAFWIDGLFIGSNEAIEVYAISKDEPSVAEHGLSMLPIARPDVKSMAEMQAIADQEVILHKDPIKKIALTCTLQPNMLFVGLKVHVKLPSHGIGSPTTTLDYRVTSIEHYISDKPIIRNYNAITKIEAILIEPGKNFSNNRILQISDPSTANAVATDRRLTTQENREFSATSGSGGSGSSGGSNGSGVEDGVVEGRFIVRDEYLDLYYYEADKDALPSDPKRMTVTEWLYGGEMGIPLPPGADWQQPVGLMFNDTREDTPGGLWHNVIHGIALRGSTNPVEGSPAIGVTKHFFVRGDFVVRGPLSSHEGYINLWGNSRNATAGNYKSGYRIGWGPTVGRKGTTAIILPEGGHGSPKFNGYYAGSQIENYTFPYNDAEDSVNYKEASTLVLAVPKNTTSYPPLNDHSRELGLSRWYGYGHFEAGNITAHGHFIGAHLWTGKDVHDSNDNIMLHSNLIPYRLPTQAAGTDGEINLGNNDYRFSNLYARNIRDKNNATGGVGYVLTRQQDGLEWKEPSTITNTSSTIKCGTGNTPQTTIPGVQTAGFVHVSFDVEFPSGVTPRVVATVKGASDPITISVRNIDRYGFDVNTLLVTTAQHNHVIGGSGEHITNPLREHVHDNGIYLTFANLNKYTSTDSGHYHGYSDWYCEQEFPNTSSERSGDTDIPKQRNDIAPYIRQIYLRWKESNGAISPFSIGGTFVNSQVSAVTLCTENYTPVAGENFIGVGTAFDWIAIAQ